MTEESMDTPLITVWIPLRDVGPDNGCLIAVPGSHRVPDSVPWPVGPELREKLDSDAVAVPAKLGDVVILHKHLAHASAPNTSNWPRWSFDLRYFDHRKPGDRPWFPSVPLRSVSDPGSVVTSGHEWRSRWEQTRERLSASGAPLPGRPVYARAVAEAYLRRWGNGDYGTAAGGH
jgi:ectoine hydroxylase-related dioxygenase (phytanoyl-CoA dioxygenase family)